MITSVWGNSFQYDTSNDVFGLAFTFEQATAELTDVITLCMDAIDVGQMGFVQSCIGMCGFTADEVGRMGFEMSQTGCY